MQAIHKEINEILNNLTYFKMRTKPYVIPKGFSSRNTKDVFLFVIQFPKWVIRTMGLDEVFKQLRFGLGFEAG